MVSTWWALTFAWLPITVDSYTDEEFRQFGFNKTVWLTPVLYSRQIWIDDDDSQTPRYRVRYRLPREKCKRWWVDMDERLCHRDGEITVPCDNHENKCDY